AERTSVSFCWLSWSRRRVKSPKSSAPSGRSIGALSSTWPKRWRRDMPASVFTNARQPWHSSTWRAISPPSRAVRSPSTNAFRSASKRAHASRARSASSRIDVGSLMARGLPPLPHRSQQLLARPPYDPLQAFEPDPHLFGGAAVLEAFHLDELQGSLLPLLQPRLEDAAVGEQAEGVHLGRAARLLVVREHGVG